MRYDDTEQEGRRAARLLGCLVLAGTTLYMLWVAATVDDELQFIAPDGVPAIVGSSVAIAGLCLFVLVGAVLRWREVMCLPSVVLWSVGAAAFAGAGFVTMWAGSIAAELVGAVPAAASALARPPRLTTDHRV